MKSFLVAVMALAVLCSSAHSASAAAQEEPRPGKETKPAYPHWLATAPYAPSFAVTDTENKYGRYSTETKLITLQDLIKYHGHFCGGLVESAAALRVAFDLLFADGIVDRTDLEIVSNNSACGGDVAAYLTGSRTRFGSHVIDSALTESEFYVREVSTGRTIHVKLNPAVYPKEVKTQMKKIESGAFEPKDIDIFQELQWEYARRMVTAPLKGSFIAEEVKDYVWPEPGCKDLGRRKDNDYKNTPLR